MPGFLAEARWSLVGSFSLPEWPGRGAREINQAGLALHAAPLTKPPEAGKENWEWWKGMVEGEGGRRMARGTARPPISTGSTGLPKCLHLEVARAFWYLGRESLSFVMRWVIVLRDTRGGGRWRGLASVGWVMDNREPCRWTGAPLQLDNPHWSRSINDGFEHTLSGGYMSGWSEGHAISL